MIILKAKRVITDIKLLLICGALAECVCEARTDFGPYKKEEEDIVE
jgi:hypothetical protein